MSRPGRAADGRVEVRGEWVPALGLGTGGLRGDACYRAVRHAVDLGYRHLDTAAVYDNEDAVGRAVRDSGVPRAEIFLTTKVWPTELAAGRVDESVADSLRRLGLDHVDLLLAHWPAPGVPLAGTMAALFAARDAGRARHVGVSNFTPGQVTEAAAAGPVFCNQVEYHPLLAQDDLIRLAGELDLMLTAYAPLARGAVGAEPAVVRIAERHGRTPAQIALRWLVQQPRVAAIPGAGSPAHQAANLEIFEFTLSAAEMAELHATARRRRLRIVDPTFAPDW